MISVKNVTKTLVSAAFGLFFVIACGGGGKESDPGAETSDKPETSFILNDSGITKGGNASSGNNPACAGDIAHPQDCHHGRDAKAVAGNLVKVGGGHAGFDFTRLNADGTEYSGSGNYAGEPWACVRDNHTGLVWEVKTDNDNIHDKDNGYRWGGKTAQGQGYGAYYSDWDTLVDGTNNATLCGLNNWRVPTANELQGIVDFNRTNPAIDTDYFPNTPRSSHFWSASPRSDNSSYATVIQSHNGQYYGNYGRGLYLRVRLVSFSP